MEDKMIQNTPNTEWMYILKQTIKVFFLFVLLLGIIYPFFITGISMLTMKDKATGSLIKKDGVITGSKLIGQKFVYDEYFKSRPSAVNYDASASGASNLGPTSKKLQILTKYRVMNIRQKYNTDKPIPPDMVTSSASGLDPHISVENAYMQAKAVAQERNLDEKTVKKLIDSNTDSDFIGIWGKKSVNVLKLNLALDAYSETQEKRPGKKSFADSNTSH